MTAPTTNRDLAHLPELSVLTAGLLLLLVAMSTMHGSDVLCVLIAAFCLLARDEWRPR